MYERIAMDQSHWTTPTAIKEALNEATRMAARMATGYRTGQILCENKYWKTTAEIEPTASPIAAPITPIDPNKNSCVDICATAAATQAMTFRWVAPS